MSTDNTNPIDTLIDRAHTLAECRARLADMARTLQREIDALKAGREADIRALVESAVAAWAALEAEIQASPDLFVKPRTVTAHGIKFGMGKGRGGLEIEDEDRTVALIEKHLPELVDVLLAVRKRPVKDALLQLPGADLKRIGVTVKNTGDCVVIKPADSEIDKIVKALVKAGVEEGGE